MLIKILNLNWLILINICQLKRLNKTKYVLGIYNAKCNKLLKSSVFVVWLENDINEFELSFFVTISFIRMDK